MAGIRLEGNTSGYVAEVDINNNQLVKTPTNVLQAGFTYLAGRNDAGTVTGVIDAAAARISDDFRLSVGVDTPLFDDTFNATTQNTGLWKYTALTLACTQAGGFLNFNPTNVTTSGAYVSMQSYRYAGMMGNTDLHFEFTGGTVGAAPLAGQVMEFGSFMPSAATAPTDGIFFRVTSAGIAGIYVNNAGTEYSTAVWGIGNLVVGTNYEFKVVFSERVIDYYVNTVEIGTLTVASGLGAPFLSQAQPLSMQFRNTALIGGAGMSWHMSDLHADYIDVALGKTHPLLQGGQGKHGSQGQNGNTMGSTSNITNNMAKGTPAALTNTTITAPACIGLGGRATYLPTLTVYQDGILMSFLNPVGGVNITPRTLYVGALRINSFVGTTLVGGPLALLYTVAYGGTTVSAAQAEVASFTTGGNKAARRIPIGSEGFAAAAAAGTMATGGGVDTMLSAPVVVNPGEYLQVYVTNVGTVTTAGDIVTWISIGSWWE